MDVFFKKYTSFVCKVLLLTGVENSVENVKSLIIFLANKFYF